jgi:hypothetical protein
LLPLEVVRYVAWDEPLLESFEVEVPCIAQQLGAVHVAADFDVVALEHLHELAEDFAALVRYIWGRDGRWSEEGTAVQAWKYLGRGREELRKAE